VLKKKSQIQQIAIKIAEKIPVEKMKNPCTIELG